MLRNEHDAAWNQVCRRRRGRGLVASPTTQCQTNRDTPQKASKASSARKKASGASATEKAKGFHSCISKEPNLSQINGFSKQPRIDICDNTVPSDSRMQKQQKKQCKYEDSNCQTEGNKRKAQTTTTASGSENFVKPCSNWDMKSLAEALNTDLDPIHDMVDLMAAREKEDRDIGLNNVRLISGLANKPCILFEEVAGEIDALGKSPISILLEYAQYLYSALNVNFIDVSPMEGPKHKPIFHMTAVVEGRAFPSVRAGNKKDCRSGAAYLAWKELLHEEKARFNALAGNRAYSLHDQMAALAHLEYLKQAERNPQGFSGRRVLSAILMRTQTEDGGRPVSVVGLGTGNRCILSPHLSMDGSVVNDSHAEVIARRAFMRFVYREFNKLPHSDILERSKEGNYFRFRKGITFHLYISQAPCGDASIFTSHVNDRLRRMNEEGMPDVGYPVFESAVHGLLRNKIEAGEGCIPADTKIIQTWIGLQFGSRLRTMSCSDKILKWNVLGIQGALLSHFLEPVFLESIIIGENFKYCHVSRGLSYRMEMGGIDVDLPIHHPVIAHSEISTYQQETEKSKPITVCWAAGDSKSEVIDGTTGRLIGKNNCVGSYSPLISKANLYTDFRTLCSKMNKPDLLSQQSYHDSKMSSSGYQNTKTAFCQKLLNCSLGFWVQKPQELDFFNFPEH